MEYRLYGAVCESFYNPETPSTCCDYNWTGVGVLLLRTISIDIASAHGRMRPYVHLAPYNLVPGSSPFYSTPHSAWGRPKMKSSDADEVRGYSAWCLGLPCQPVLYLYQYCTCRTLVSSVCSDIMSTVYGVYPCGCWSLAFGNRQE